MVGVSLKSRDIERRCKGLSTLSTRNKPALPRSIIKPALPRSIIKPALPRSIIKVILYFPLIWEFRTSTSSTILAILGSHTNSCSSKNAVTSDDDEWVTRHEWNIRDHGEGASFAMLLPKGNANGDNRIQYDKGKWEKLIVCNVLFDLRKRQKVSIKGFDGLLLVAFELTQIIEFFSKFVKSDPQITPGKLAELWYNCALKVTVKEKVISHAIKEYEQVNKTKFKWEKYSCTMHECPHVVLGPKLGYMVIDPLDESGHHGNT